MIPPCASLTQSTLKAPPTTRQGTRLRRLPWGCHSASVAFTSTAGATDNRDDWLGAQERLIAEARRLVDRHWDAIEALAKAVLAQPLTQRPEDAERQWSRDSMERWVDGNQVVSILKQFGMEPFIHGEANGKFYPKGLRPGSMTTANARWIEFPGHSLLLSPTSGSGL